MAPLSFGDQDIFGGSPTGARLARNKAGGKVVLSRRLSNVVGLEDWSRHFCFRPPARRSRSRMLVAEAATV